MPAAADCPACRAPRGFELQVMPALHQALAEGLSWQQQKQQQQHEGVGAAGTGSPAEPSIESWSWLSLAVFTCSASCGGSSDGGGPCLAEEVVHLLNE